MVLGGQLRQTVQVLPGQRLETPLCLAVGQFGFALPPYSGIGSAAAVPARWESLRTTTLSAAGPMVQLGQRAGQLDHDWDERPGAAAVFEDVGAAGRACGHVAAER